MLSQDGRHARNLRVRACSVLYRVGREFEENLWEARWVLAQVQPFKRPFGLVRVGERQIARNISLRQPLLAALS